MTWKRVTHTFSNLFKEGDTLSQKASRGVFWVFLTNSVLRVTTLAKLVIVARLLGPEELGLMGIALLIRSFLNTTTRTGVNFALIQKEDNIIPYLNTAWTISIIRNTLLFILLLIIAPFASDFFHEPRALNLVAAMSIIVLINGFTNIGIVYFQKELNYRREFLYTIIQLIPNITISIILAFTLGNVWALYFGMLAETITKLFLSFILHPYRPRIGLNIEKAIELLHFGKWILLSTLMGYFILEGDDIIVANMIGIISLGLYQMAYKFANIVTTQVSQVISRVTMPTYSRLQSDIEKVRRTYLTVLQISLFINVMFTTLLFSLSYEITLVILGNEWLGIVEPMKILIIAGFIRSIASNSGPLFFGLGRPKLDALWQLVRLIVMVILIIPFTTKWGLTGAAFVVMISIFIANIGFSYHAIKLTRTKISTFSKLLIIPIFIGILSYLTIYIFLTVIQVDSLLELMVTFIIGGLSYLLFAFLADKILDYQIFPIIYRNIKRIN